MDPIPVAMLVGAGSVLAGVVAGFLIAIHRDIIDWWIERRRPKRHEMVDISEAIWDVHPSDTPLWKKVNDG